MQFSIDPRDREILEFIHRCSGADIPELCDLLGVTRTAIRQRLARLESAGLLFSDLQSQTRGRPRHCYHLSPEGLHALGENYRELAIVLWKTIIGVEDSELRSRLISQVQDAFAKRYQQSGKEESNVDDRVRRLASELKASGFSVEAERSGGLHILRETFCPFPMLAEIDETICQVERQVLEQVLGSPVEFGNRCRDGHSCCEFHVKSEEPASG
ncbi:MAG: winged helix-turn-helix transcriptional regulator [Planctomycetaceae bacterium]|nr:winged helix-turn-helix transcriptional regulator [Planctomycetaceae bacterium]